MWFAKYDISSSNNQKIHGILELSHADDALRLPLNEDEALTPISQSDADAFLQHRNAHFVDGIFTSSAPEYVPPVRDLEETRSFKIKELERYTPGFISYNGSSVRYTKEKQSSFHGIYIRCERLSRLPETASEVRSACEAKIALIESVYAWIESVLAQHYVHLNALKDAETIEDLDAITWDYSALNATDPDVWLEHVI